MSLSLSTLLPISALSFCAYSAPIDAISGQFPLGLSFGVPGNQSFDYVVVGGGTAGLTLANRLSENPSFKVAVVEAGGFYEIQNGDQSEIPADDYIGTDKNNQSYNPLVDWGFVTVPQQAMNGEQLHYARGKGLGGCSVRNYMAYTRGTKDSYDQWAEVVGDSSYSFENWLPYFQRSLDFSPPQPGKRAANATPQYDASNIGEGGPLSVTYPNYAQPVSSWVSKGLQAIGVNPTDSFTSGNLIGSSYILNTIQADSMLRETSETGFLQPGLKRSNLVVYTESLAKRILFNGKTAAGVRVDTGGKEYVLSATKEIILSAGAFQSPQLLMVSGIGPASTLEKFGIPPVADRAGVGQNMWDHVFFGPSYRVDVVTDSSLANAQVAAQATTDFETKQEGILTNPVGDFFAFEKLPNSSLAASYNTTSSLSAFSSDWPEVEYLSVAAYLGEYYDLATGPDDGHNYAALVAALVAPLSRGTVSISSADMADPPIIDPQWLSNPVDQVVAVAAYKRVQQALSSSAMAPVVMDSPYWSGANETQTDAQILQTVKKLAMTVWHASCTNKMGMVNDTMAVVDSKARVIGVQNLRVVDASSFAILPPGHPLATVYALAEKIADDIKSDAGSSGYS